MCGDVGLFLFLLEKKGGGLKRVLETPDFLWRIPLRRMVAWVFPCVHWKLSAASLELLNLGLLALDDQLFSSCAVRALGCHMCLWSRTWVWFVTTASKMCKVISWNTTAAEVQSQKYACLSLQESWVRIVMAILTLVLNFLFWMP